MKIYTRLGDSGETSMLGNKRVKKSCLEMDVIGELDELNAAIGVLFSQLEKDKFNNTRELLRKIQCSLFVIGSNIAALQTEIKSVSKLTPDNITELEDFIDHLDNDLEQIANFILPGGHPAAAQSYLARAVCRRAERRLIDLSDKYNVDSTIKQYLNRLSDLLFVLARWVNKKSNEPETLWKS